MRDIPVKDVAARMMRGAALAAALVAGGCAGFDPPALDALNPFAGRAAVTPDDPAVTETPVGSEIARIRRALVDLRGSAASGESTLASARGQLDAVEARYRGLHDGMTATLSAGAAPGDPALLAQWREAEGVLGNMDGRIAALSARQPTETQYAARAATLAARVRAARDMPGGNEEDAKQLDRLAGQVGETQSAIDRTLNGIGDEVARRSATVAAERRALSSLSLAIASGRLAGSDLAGRVAPAATGAAPDLSAPETRRPLATIAFTRPDIDFRQPLYNAVSAAVDREPGVAFDVIAIAPARGEPADQRRALAAARGNAERVAQSIAGMGVPADRVRLAARGDPGVAGNEVRVYVR